MEQTTPSVYSMAMGYSLTGWSVIPVIPKDKRPLGSWKEFQERHAGADELQAWFEGTENNVGIVAGKLSNLTIVDCDSQEAIEYFESRSQGHLNTYQVKTPKGRHYYYKFVPGSNNFQAKKEWPGIDLRSEGGYVVAPPSIHPSGVAYEIEKGGDLAEAPKWLFEQALKVATEEGKQLPTEDPFLPAKQGRRNQSAAVLAGSLFKEGLPKHKVLKMCEVWNKLNDPPLEHGELVTVVESISKKEHAKQESLGRGEDVEQLLGCVCEPESFADDLQELRKTGIPKGISTGWATLDDFYRVAWNEMTIVTGTPGSGKSNWLTHLAIQLMENEGWKFLIFSAENLPIQHYLARMSSMYLKKPFHHGDNERLTSEEVKYAGKFFQEHVRFFDPGERLFTISGILDVARYYQETWGFQGLIIDPWNEIDHQLEKGYSETNVIGKELGAIRTFTRTHPMHTWVLAHPRQPQRGKDGNFPVPTLSDISGSKDFKAKADMGICVDRRAGFDQDGNFVLSPNNDIHVQKVRHVGQNGQVGMVTLGFDPVTWRFKDQW